MTEVPSCLLGKWVHAREEDTEGSRTYRPSGWPLPLSRLPRHVLEFEPDHGTVSRVGGPADTRIGHEGRWDIEPCKPPLLRLTWQNRPPTLVEVTTCVNDLLQLRVISGSIE